MNKLQDTLTETNISNNSNSLISLTNQSLNDDVSKEQKLLEKSKHKKSTGPKAIPITDIVFYAEKGLSVTDIGYMVGCTPQNVSDRLEKIGYSRGLIGRYRDGKKDLIELAEAKLASAVISKDLDKSGLRDVTDALSKIHNIGRLEAGKSTQNISLHADIAELKALENLSHVPNDNVSCAVNDKQE